MVRFHQMKTALIFSGMAEFGLTHYLGKVTSLEKGSVGSNPTPTTILYTRSSKVERMAYNRVIRVQVTTGVPFLLCTRSSIGRASVL